MTVAPARARAIRSRLLSWWDTGHRDLPWRFPQDRADPYRVWISEVMLQQTRVSVVVPYYERFVARLPTLASLACATEDEVLSLWSGLGYYARGRRLIVAAREALARHGGLPGSCHELAALPGFGPYTAGAVASIAFRVRAPCVDGNVERVLRRVFLIEADSVAAQREATWTIAGALVPPGRPGDFNQALMELGALVCTPERPACARCPLARLCHARRTGRAGEIAARRARRRIPSQDVACALIRRGSEVLLVRRVARGLLEGLWGLPFALGPSAEEARASLAPAVRQATGLSVRPGAEVASVERILTHRRLRIRAYECGEVRRRVTLPPGCHFHPVVASGMSAPPKRAGPLRGGIATAMRVLLEAVPQNGQNTLTRRGAPV